MESLLTAFSEPTRKPGRPPRISDEALHRNRDELLFVLAENWALIGWELQQAVTPSDFRTTLRRIQGLYCRSLELFRLEYRRATTFSQLQAARVRLKRVSDKLREAQHEWEKHKSSVEAAESALATARDAQKRKELRAIYEESEIAATQASTKLSQCQQRLTGLQGALQRREAAFAQSELLDFIQSDRYTSTPLSFANAMAGLPAIRWRQSMARCINSEKAVLHGLTYGRFRFVVDALKHRGADLEEAVEGMKARLLQAKGEDVRRLNELAENWYYLRCSIESVFQAERPPAGALPYRVFAEYQRRIASQAPPDTLLAEKEIIVTPAYLKERSNAGI